MAYATLTTALLGDDNDLVFTSRIEGRTGNLLSVEYIKPLGANQALDIDVDGLAIKVWLATDASGEISSTSNALKAALAAHPVASSLVSVADAAANDGSGLLTAMSTAYLSGAAGAVASYASVAQLREYLGQVKSGATMDVMLQNILDRATAIVNGALGFSFAEYGAAADMDVRAQGGEYLEVPAYKAASLSAIKAVTARGTEYETTETVTGWTVDETVRPYLVYRYGYWTPGQWYRVNAIWGYGPAPDEIVEVTLEAASNIWRAKDASFGQSEIGVQGQGAVNFNRALTWAQRSIIEAVRAAYLGVVFA